MCKNVDLIAVGLLLLGLAFVSQVRKSAAVEYQSVRVVNFTARQLQHLSIRPHIPQLCLFRD